MKFVFDLGNVMVYYQPVAYLEQLGYGGSRLEELKRAIFDSKAWLDCDAGTLDRAAETEAMCAEHPELEADIRRVMEHCEEMLLPIPGSVRALESLTRRGYECYYLSNTNAPAMDFMGGFDYFRLFRGGVASYAELLAKPDPAIFRLFLERFGIADAQECVFIDDSQPNVDAARACGMNAHRRADVEGLEALVEDILAGRV